MVHDSQSPEIIEKWLRDGADLELDILPTIKKIAARNGEMSIESYAYFTSAIMDAKRDRDAGGGRYLTPEAAMAACREKAKRDMEEWNTYGTITGVRIPANAAS